MDPLEAKLRASKYVRTDGASFILDQTFAVVRHGDRLDHTPRAREVLNSAYPNDTPLSPPGFPHAKDVGMVLHQSKAHFKLIVCSPYFRCAQTASCIAQILKIPVHFDLDIGEVFDDVSMEGDCKDKPQHRAP